MTIPQWARTGLREPLVQFLIAGAALFVFFAWKGEPVDPASRTIEISLEDRARLSLQWERTMQRPPTDAELDRLTETWLREEILYREALRLGLDRDDAVVRKRLANKMNFLASSMVETAQPSDETLSTWLADNPQRFADDTTYSFDQLYFAEKDDAEAALAKISSADNWKGLGEAISLPPASDNLPSRQVEGHFGSAFLDNLRSIETPGAWSGPVVSGFGWHLIRLRARNVGKVPPLEDIRQRVENDWRTQTLETRQDEAYQLLRDAYEVSVER
ncbi:peptidyl-prolyl cis-trans isomerase [Pontixanthobacter aquaemixtae]|uniref:Parvulin-like PPIase n=1 Tax=Pontixanthobacter aquaemixtae TaxID=1958940 RepID=A0A844ZY69_9SPHN|nr:peptidylprolyl isomerase [Pontixanthobacter aquaemixtae]MXO91697.1 peptidyl-prolyl cis-trans isomerase [Pontixanthobacter aquaemixtae]